MSIATMTSKGQLTVPVEVRKRFGLDAGAQVEFVEGAQGQLMLLVKTRDIQEFRGVLSTAQRVLDDAALDDAIDQGWGARQRGA